MTYILTKAQIQILRSRVRPGITVTRIMQAAVDAVISGNAKVAPNYLIMEKSQKVPLSRMSVKKRLPGIGSREMRQILDAYFKLDSHVNLQDQIDRLDGEIATMMNQTISRGTKKLATALKGNNHE